MELQSDKSQFSAESHLQKGQDLAVQGKYREAIREYTSALKLNPNFIEVYLERASVYIQLENFEQARKELESVPLLFSQEPYFYQMRGSLYYCLEDYYEALEDFNTAILYDSQNSMLYWSRGITYSILGNFRYAVVDLEKALDICSQRDIEVSSDSILDIKLELARAYFDLGMGRWCEGDTEEAFQYLNVSVRLNPSEFQTYCFRGLLFSSLGNFKAAVKNYFKAIKINPEAAEPYLLLGLTLRYKLKRAEVSIKYFNKAILADNKFPEAYLLRGLTHYSLGNTDDGIADLERISKICSIPSTIEAEISSGKMSSEIRAFLHRIYPGFGMIWNPALVLMRAIFKLRAGNLDGATKDCSALRQLFSSSIEHQSLIFDPKTGLEPTSAYIGLGVFYYAIGENQEAIDFFSKATGTNPEMPLAYWIRGIILYELGDAQNAIWDVKEAIKLFLSRGDTKLLHLAVDTLTKFEKPYSIFDKFDRVYLHIERNKKDTYSVADELKHKRQIRTGLKSELVALYQEQNAHKRGNKLESILNSLFDIEGILVRKSFTIEGENNEGIIQQIDGSIEVNSHLYLVEMKWWKDPLGPRDVAQHMMRIFLRPGDIRGIFISASGYTEAAIIDIKKAINQKIIVLFTLKELVLLLESEDSFESILKSKVEAVQHDGKLLYDL